MPIHLSMHKFPILFFSFLFATTAYYVRVVVYQVRKSSMPIHLSMHDALTRNLIKGLETWRIRMNLLLLLLLLLFVRACVRAPFVSTAICEPGKQRSNVRLMPLDSVFECSFQHDVSQITVALTGLIPDQTPPSQRLLLLLFSTLYLWQFLNCYIVQVFRSRKTYRHAPKKICLFGQLSLTGGRGASRRVVKLRNTRPTW
jgi:hypothetical protein